MTTPDTLSLEMAAALRRLDQARERVSHETRVWGAPAREATWALDSALRRVRHLESALSA